MRKLAVLLLSGGLDSSTVAAYAQKQGYELKAITIHYGQKHGKEVKCARKIAAHLGIEQEVVDVSFFKRLAWYSALTNPETMSIPKSRRPEDMPAEIPITYVPLRNTLFISMAAAFLESEALHLIEVEKVSPAALEAYIFIAANTVDYSGYPDCRPEYYEQMAKSVTLGSKLGAMYGKAIQIQTPIIMKSKAEIVRLAVDLRVPLQHTWSCYEGGEAPCGRCDSCLLRAKGFAEAGIIDPLVPGSRPSASTDA